MKLRKYHRISRQMSRKAEKNLMARLRAKSPTGRAREVLLTDRLPAILRMGRHRAILLTERPEAASEAEAAAQI
jgi:hypothetical protein